MNVLSILGRNEKEDFSGLTDENILINSVNSPSLFSIIVDRYQSAFLRKAKGILHDEEASVDAVQDTFVKIYKNASKFKEIEGARFSSWAYKILLNTCFTIYQKIKKEKGEFVQLSYEMEQVLEDRVSSSSQKQFLDKDLVNSLLSRLPNKLKEVIELYFLEELPQREIAEKLNVSEEVIRTRIHRAKKELKNINFNIA